MDIEDLRQGDNRELALTRLHGLLQIQAELNACSGVDECNSNGALHFNITLLSLKSLIGQLAVLFRMLETHIPFAQTIRLYFFPFGNCLSTYDPETRRLLTPQLI